MSTGPGPGFQNLILPLATQPLGGKKVVSAYPGSARPRSGIAGS